VYQQVTDVPGLAQLMQGYLEDFNATSTTPMKLVLFMDAMEHVSRVCRIISQPLGHALLLGVGCSGRRSLARLAAYTCDYEVVQVEVAKNYGAKEFREVRAWRGVEPAPGCSLQAPCTHHHACVCRQPPTTRTGPEACAQEGGHGGAGGGVSVLRHADYPRELPGGH
jgi:hypothetical protein